MSYELDMKEIERKAYLYYSEDGLADIALGAVILTWGIFLLAEPSGLIGLLGILALGIWYLGKRFITIPRSGIIQPSQKMERKMRNLAIFLVVIGVIILGGLIAGRIAGYSFSGSFTLGVLGLVLAGGVSVLAYLLNAARLYAYAVLIFVAFAGGEILSSNITTFDAFAISVILSGALILISGLIVLARFLRRYPLPQQEA